MKLTKHAHACVEIEIDDVIIVIDPSEFEHKAEKIAKNAHVVLYTHAHGDHLDKDAITKALNDNPDLIVYAPVSVAETLGSFGGRVIAVKPGDEFSVESVPVRVLGTGRHAEIHPSIPTIDNLCYLVGGKIYHPGDSFDLPGVPIDTLLVPTSGPWMKLAEAADFVKAVNPRRSIPIHDMINSEVGEGLVEKQLGKGGITGIELVHLDPGKSLKL